MDNEISYEQIIGESSIQVKIDPSLSIEPKWRDRLVVLFIFLSLAFFAGLVAVVIVALLGMPPTLTPPRCKLQDRCNANCSYWRTDIQSDRIVSDVTVLCLTGEFEQMGKDYGAILSRELNYTLLELEGVLKHPTAAHFADRYFQRLPSIYKQFVSGIAAGSNNNLDNVKLLVAMETLSGFFNLSDNRLLSSESVVTTETTAVTVENRSSVIFATNHGLPSTFQRLPLVVAILRPVGYNPVTMVTYPGQITCSMCMNSDGLVTAMTNAGDQGGWGISHPISNIQGSAIEALHQSIKLDDLSLRFNSMQTDMSVVSVYSDSQVVKTTEFSVFNERKSFLPSGEKMSVTTNYFHNEDWGKNASGCSKVLKASDLADWAWSSKLRESNLLMALKQLSNSLNVTVDSVKLLIMSNISDGGAKLDRTFYHTVVDASRKIVSVKLHFMKNWLEIDLNKWEVRKAHLLYTYLEEDEL